MSLFIKNIFLVQLYLILAILYPTSLANLVVEVGTRHSHQTLFHGVIQHDVTKAGRGVIYIPDMYNDVTISYADFQTSQSV